MLRRTLAATLLAVAAVITVPQAPVALADAANGGGDFVATPSIPVVLDTRDGTGGATADIGQAATLSFPVLGVSGVPSTGVGAVLARITVLHPTEPTFATLWPDGTTRPNQTTVAAGTGEDLSATAIVKVGGNGKLSVYNAFGKADVVVEVQGYYKSAQGTTGGGFVPVPQTRLFDTRSGLGTTKAVIAAGATRTITITGTLVPATAAAVQLNLLVPGASAVGWLNGSPTGATGRPVMNYETGSTQQNVVLDLSDSGQVTFTNKGTTAIDLSATVEGYYASSSTQGAGLRLVGKRLLNTRTTVSGLPIAANSTIDVQVGGTNGMPTRGVAGAMIGLVVTPEAAGYLKVWPVGTAADEPTVSMMDFKAGLWRANSLVLKPGTDGKIRIRNGSSGTAHLIVDLQGWFADPLPAVEVAKSTRVSVKQLAPIGTGATDGFIEYAYTDDSGRVVAGHQSDPGAFASTIWSVISGNEAFSGQPALSQLSNGLLQVSAQYTDGDVWADGWSGAPSTIPTWNAWSDFGGSMASPPVSGALSDKSVVQFAVDVDGKLWAYAQTGAVPYWRNLGDRNLTADLSVVRVRDGVRVFGLDTAGTLQTIEYYDDGSVSAWANLGGTGLSGQPSVVVRPGYVLQVFVRGVGGAIVNKLQNGDGSWPADFQPVGTFLAAGAPSAVLDAGLGRVVVAARGTDDLIGFVWETATGSNAWGEWKPAPGDPAASDPTGIAYSYQSGQLQSSMFVFRTVNNAVRVYGRDQFTP